ncbi:reverse transcriptase domain, reverse transcriptase zinc-binding domain protein [Tanacetum coccineum]
METLSFASIFNIQPSTLSCTYLGLRISSNMSKGFNWKPIIDKVHNKLNSWKARTLSYGGRLTLLKSVHGALAPTPGPEASQLKDLLEILQQFAPSNFQDKWICILDNSKSYQVSFMRKFIEEKSMGMATAQTRWNKNLPIKINVFSWRLIRDRMPTHFNLDLRGIVVDSTRFPVCDEAIETSQHLFVECTIASSLCSMVATWWGFANFPKILGDLIQWGDRVTYNKPIKACFDTVVQTTFWTIWNYRNKLCFDLKPTQCMRTPRPTLYEQNETPGGSIYWEPHVEGIPIPVEGTYYGTIDEALDMYTKYAEIYN